ncbi:hypothetical protein, partial [Microtetraspora niveoalba]|uniref:hypothetical protein n=1 Tax=Microtetraspora niveoalba TaxID=46175 RepID=UPI001C3F3A1A
MTRPPSSRWMSAMPVSSSTSASASLSGSTSSLVSCPDLARPGTVSGHAWRGPAWAAALAADLAAASPGLGAEPRAPPGPSAGLPSSSSEGASGHDSSVVCDPPGLGLGFGALLAPDAASPKGARVSAGGRPRL